MTKSSTKDTPATGLQWPTHEEILEEMRAGQDFVEHILESAPNGYEPSEAFVDAVATAFSLSQATGSHIAVYFEPEVIELHFGPVPGRHTIH